jgi:hypothetical protein
MIPDCTLSTACFCMKNAHQGARSLEETIDSTNMLMAIPVYLVIYGDKHTIPLLRTRREQYGLSNITVFHELEANTLWSFQYIDKVRENREIYFPTKDERTSPETHLITCNKFTFVLNTIDSNPFSTTKFGWVDSFLGKDNIKICENYEPNVLPWILSNITDKFHIQVLGCCDKKYKTKENKHEYYNTYKWIVCGGFFTCGELIGKKILNRLNEIFVSTTLDGYGHGEEMFYIEVLDEFYDDIVRSYGDYGQMWDNFINLKKNYHYVYYFILKKYIDFGYWREAYDCCMYILNEIENHCIYIIPNVHMNIILDYLIVVYHYCPNKSKDLVESINKICSQNELLNREYQKEKWRIEWYLWSIKDVFG